MKTTTKTIEELTSYFKDSPVPLGAFLLSFTSLCSSVSWKQQEDGQFVSLTINFLPEMQPKHDGKKIIDLINEKLEGSGLEYYQFATYYVLHFDLPEGVGVFDWLEQEVAGVSLAALTAVIEEWLKK